MVDIELKPFPGEDDISFSKRKAYFIRIVKPRMNYGNTAIEKKLVSAVPLTQDEREESWDFAINEDGQPVLIEFNVTFAGLDVHHVCNGPVLGDLTDNVLKDVFANSYTLTSILKSLK